MKHELPYNVPQGYFDQLEYRLKEIPGRRRFLPAVSVALVTACVALMIVAGGYLRQRSIISEQDAIAEYLIETNVPLYYFEEN
ncbi:MAG: hypothetical protein MJY57_04155 [Bacteroidales bacterium]|nr:hypothetical protein [Bacteroidales bacterium]